MRKNKGFTLIELLAVIVILAIIAVITVPKVAEMISESRKGAANDAFFGTIKASELAWAKKLQTDQSLGGVTCTVGTGKVLECKATGAADGAETLFTVNVSGSSPAAGTVTIGTDGAASATDLEFNGYKCSGNSSTTVTETTPCTK